MSEPRLSEWKERPYTDALPSVCYTYFSGLPASGSSPTKQSSVLVLKDFQDYATILAYPANPKIGGIGVQTMDKKNWHRVVRILPNPVFFPKGVVSVKTSGEWALPKEKRRWQQNFQKLT
jgi:hypothetical protein